MAGCPYYALRKAGYLYVEDHKAAFNRLMGKSKLNIRHIQKEADSFFIEVEPIAYTRKVRPLPACGRYGISSFTCHSQRTYI